MKLKKLILIFSIISITFIGCGNEQVVEVSNSTSVEDVLDSQIQKEKARKIDDNLEIDINQEIEIAKNEDISLEDYVFEETSEDINKNNGFLRKPSENKHTPTNIDTNSSTEVIIPQTEFEENVSIDSTYDYSSQDNGNSEYYEFGDDSSSNESQMVGEEVDISKFSKTAAYSELYNICMDPTNYIGKTLTIKGACESFIDSTGKTWHCLEVYDGAGCCSIGVAYEISSGDYPSNKTGATISGKFNYCTIDGTSFFKLSNATLK